MVQIDGLVQDCSNSIATALELLQSCTKSSRWKNSFAWNTKDLVILHSQCCGCWCIGDARSQGISSYGTDIELFPEYSAPAPERPKVILEVQLCYFDLFLPWCNARYWKSLWGDGNLLENDCAKHTGWMGYVAWWALLELLSWYPIMQSSICNSLKNHASID